MWVKVRWVWVQRWRVWVEVRWVWVEVRWVWVERLRCLWREGKVDGEVREA